MPGAWEGAWRSTGKDGTERCVCRCGRTTVSITATCSACPLVTTLTLPLAISPAFSYAQCTHLGCHEGSNVCGLSIELLHGGELGCTTGSPQPLSRMVNRQFGPRQQQQGQQLRANKPTALFCCHKLVVRVRKVGGSDDAPRCRAVEIVVVYGVTTSQLQQPPGSSTNVGQVQAKGGLHRCQTDPHASTAR